MSFKARVELYSSEGIIIVDLNNGLGPIIELEGEGAIDDQASVKASRLHLNPVGIAAGTLFLSTFKYKENNIHFYVKMQ